MAAFDFTEHKVILADADYDTVARARAAYSLKGLTQFSGFETGKMVLSALDVFAPDLIVVDLNLPDVNGLELIRQIRAHDGGKFAKLPTLLLVAKEDAGQLKEAGKLGIDGVLRKPLNSGKLLRMTELAIVKSQSSGSYIRPVTKTSGGVVDVLEAPEEKKKEELSPAGAIKIAKEAGEKLKSRKATPDPVVIEEEKPAVRPVVKAPEKKAEAPKITPPKVAPPKTEAKVEKPPEQKAPEKKEVAKPAPEKKVPLKAEAKKAAEKGVEAAPVEEKKPEPPKKVEEEDIIDLEEALELHQLWVDTAYKEGKQCSVKGKDMRAFKLAEMDIAHIQVVGGRFDGMDLSGTIFRKSNLSGSIFNGATMVKANLAVCRLKMAKFKKANLAQADFRGSDLSQADFSGANLSGCDLNAAFLEGANLTGANLSTAKGLILSQIRRAKYDKTTKLPGYLLQQKKATA